MSIDSETVAEIPSEALAAEWLAAWEGVPRDEAFSRMQIVMLNELLPAGTSFDTTTYTEYDVHSHDGRLRHNMEWQQAQTLPDDLTQAQLLVETAGVVAQASNEIFKGWQERRAFMKPGGQNGELRHVRQRYVLEVECLESATREVLEEIGFGRSRADALATEYRRIVWQLDYEPIAGKQ